MGFKRTQLTQSFVCCVIDNRDRNNTLHNCGKEVGRRNAVFGELYHVSGILEQAGSVSQLVDVVQESGLRN